jgi:hypothetical protein
LFGKWAFGEALQNDDAEQVGLEVMLWTCIWEVKKYNDHI